MSEIRRLDQPDTRPRPKIVGAADIDATGRPQVLDRKTKQEQVVPEIRVHTEEVSEDDQIRQDRSPDSPEVRIRSSDQKRWEQVKRLESDEI